MLTATCLVCLSSSGRSQIICKVYSQAITEACNEKARKRENQTVQ